MSLQVFEVKDGHYTNGGWTCSCGLVPEWRTSRTIRTNGKKFLRCPTNSNGGQCDFFLWELKVLEIERHMASKSSQQKTFPSILSPPQTPQKIKQEPTDPFLSTPTSPRSTATSSLTPFPSSSNRFSPEERAELPTPPAPLSSSNGRDTRSPTVSPSPAGRNVDISSLSISSGPSSLFSKIIVLLTSEENIRLQAGTQIALRALIEGETQKSQPHEISSYRRNEPADDLNESGSKKGSWGCWR